MDIKGFNGEDLNVGDTIIYFSKGKPTLAFIKEIHIEQKQTVLKLRKNKKYSSTITLWKLENVVKV